MSVRPSRAASSPASAPEPHPAPHPAPPPAASLRRRTVLALPAALAAGPARAAFPGERPVTLVVPFAPGGNADIVARAVAGPMGQWLGQSVVVDNRGGGGGAIGTAWVAKAAADGHTLLAATPGQLGTLPQLFKTPYQLADFAPLGVLSRTAMALVVQAGDRRFPSVASLVAHARAHPGQLNVGHAGPGSPNHLALLQFEDVARCRFTPVAYRGSGPALVDLLSGQIDLMFDQVSSSLPHLAGGALSALLVLGPSRDAHLPDVRTLKEAGLAAFDASTFIGLLAPRGVPAAVLARLTAVARQLAADAGLDRRLRDMGSAAFHADPPGFAALLKADEALARVLIQQGRLVNG